MDSIEIKQPSRVGIVHFEKRKYPRFAIDLPIEYQAFEFSANHPGRAINASEGGLLVVLPELAEAGSHLKLKLFFAFDAALTTIEAVVQVVWTDLHLGIEWGDYATGVRFVEISEEDLAKLKSFLQSLSK
jgi:hypothetical protein